MELLSHWPQQRGQDGLRQGANNHAGLCVWVFVTHTETDIVCVCFYVHSGFEIVRTVSYSACFRFGRMSLMLSYLPALLLYRAVTAALFPMSVVIVNILP